MTWEERRRAISELGFTERQAGFLVTVMLHAGVCLGRHYCTYARIAYGQKMHDFFQSLLARGYATARACGHGKARLYHVHHKELYRVIGEPNNRYRRPTTLPRAIERLMMLDAVLADRTVAWLATERDKVAHFTLTFGIRPADLPARTYHGQDGETVRYFPDKLPIAFDADRRAHVFLFLVTQRQPMEFRVFLERHAELWRALTAWSVRLLVPLRKADAVPLYQEAFQQQLASPLSPAVLEDLRWYFHARRNCPTGPDERLYEAADAFGAPRFRALHRAFLERGEPVLDATLSPTLADAIARKTGRLECHVLPHRYLHLFTLVGTA
jgi:hypothetical protein